MSLSAMREHCRESWLRRDPRGFGTAPVFSHSLTPSLSCPPSFSNANVTMLGHHPLRHIVHPFTASLQTHPVDIQPCSLLLTFHLYTLPTYWFLLPHHYASISFLYILNNSFHFLINHTQYLSVLCAKKKKKQRNLFIQLLSKTFIFIFFNNYLISTFTSTDFCMHISLSLASFWLLSGYGFLTCFPSFCLEFRPERKY